jgi:hypothetical protein
MSRYTTRSWCTWRESNPQSVSYKETATCQLAATRTWCQRLNSNQLQQGYETCAISTSASLANLARAEGFEPPSSALEADSLALSLRPHFPEELSKTNKKPGARPGPVHKQIHSDPQHTTPQMTRFVILVIPRLKVCCISLAFSYSVPQLVKRCNSILVWIEFSC